MTWLPIALLCLLPLLTLWLGYALGRRGIDPRGSITRWRKPE